MQELADRGLVSNWTWDAKEILAVAAREPTEDVWDDALDHIH